MDALRVTRCFLCLCLAAISATVSAAELRLLNWEAYLSPEVIDRFHRQTGHRVTVVSYDSDAKRDDILASTAAQQFDLAVIDNYSTHHFAASGLLLRLTQQPLAPHTATRWQRSCGPHASPYFWGTLGIAYRADKVTTAPQSWSDLLTPNAALQGHVGMLLDAIDTLVPALKHLGLSMNTDSEADLKAAYRVLQQQQPHVLTHQYPLTFLEGPNGDQLHMALAYSGDVHALNQGKPDPWRYTIPKEGTALWVDCLAVLAHSAHQEAALAFVHFLQQPPIAALNATDVGTATTSEAAYALLDDAMRHDRTLYPTGLTLADSESYQPLSPANLQVRERIIEALRHHETQ